MSSPDPERVREALKQSIYPPGVESAPGTAEAEWIDAMHEVHRAARAWLAGSSPDYEAAAMRLAEKPQAQWDNWQEPWKDEYRRLARAAIAAAFPGLFEERPQ